MIKLNISSKCRKTELALSKESLDISTETVLGQSAYPVQMDHFL